MLRNIVAVLIWICLAQIDAHASEEVRYRELLDVIPNGPIRLGHAKGVSWAEYCPDETCDVIRTRRRIDRENLAGFALAYFFYVSDYSYLRTWHGDESAKKTVDLFLEDQGSRECGDTAERVRSICVLRSLATAYQIEILFIRHDEHSTKLQRISRETAIK